MGHIAVGLATWGDLSLLTIGSGGAQRPAVGIEVPAQISQVELVWIGLPTANGRLDLSDPSFA